ncbi:hypothetical protein V6N11_083640 [Hibiscus sabdariffa]|uniref:Uncharacterized protein n=1 Tax=Hibiscus sabdariffa TaxID=183260 RepID=A0ABR2QC78_9ROSI
MYGCMKRMKNLICLSPQILVLKVLRGPLVLEILYLSSNVQVPAAPSTSVIANSSSTIASLCMLRVYLRTYALEQMVQAASSSTGLWTIKRVEQTLQDLGTCKFLCVCEATRVSHKI